MPHFCDAAFRQGASWYGVCTYSTILQLSVALVARSSWPKVSLRLYLSLFSSLEYSEIRNSSSVAPAEMFSTGQVTASAR